MNPKHRLTPITGTSSLAQLVVWEVGATFEPGTVLTIDLKSDLAVAAGENDFVAGFAAYQDGFKLFIYTRGMFWRDQILAPDNYLKAWERCRQIALCDVGGKTVVALWPKENAVSYG